VPEEARKNGARTNPTRIYIAAPGDRDAVVAVLDYLLPEGVLVTLENYDGSKDVYRSKESAFSYPAAILVNQGTASAAELFSACMRDYGAATLVGEKTYGKGVAQSVFPLPDGSAVKITTAKYYSPHTKNYDGVGITPDVSVKNPETLTDFAHTQIENDPVLQTAKDILS
jgi:carboxyl-terminal processing protease